MSSAAAMSIVGPQPSSQFEIISTERMQLVPISSEKHANDMKQIFQSATIMREYGGIEQDEKGFSALAHTWVKESKTRPFTSYGMYAKNTSDFIGYCGLTGSGEDGVAELGYIVLPLHRRKGYATEAAQALMVLAVKLFKEKAYLGSKPFYKIEASILCKNAHSAKIARTIGMKGPVPNSNDYFRQIFSLDLTKQLA